MAELGLKLLSNLNQHEKEVNYAYVHLFNFNLCHQIARIQFQLY